MIDLPPPATECVRVTKCPEDKVYIVMEDGRILWNGNAAFLIEHALAPRSYEYWIAKKLWAYECYLRTVN